MTLTLALTLTPAPTTAQAQRRLQERREAELASSAVAPRWGDNAPRRAEAAPPPLTLPSPLPASPMRGQASRGRAGSEAEMEAEITAQFQARTDARQP